MVTVFYLLVFTQGKCRFYYKYGIVKFCLSELAPSFSRLLLVSCRCFLVLRSRTATSWMPSTAERTRSTSSPSDGYEHRTRAVTQHWAKHLSHPFVSVNVWFPLKSTGQIQLTHTEPERLLCSSAPLLRTTCCYRPSATTRPADPKCLWWCRPCLSTVSPSDFSVTVAEQWCDAGRISWNSFLISEHRNSFDDID